MTSLRIASVRLSVAAPELAAVLDTVRFAASTDPELPMLGGVLFDIEGESLHAVATDRYRMAVARAGVAGHDGDRVQVIVPSSGPSTRCVRSWTVRDLRDSLSTVTRVTLEAGDRQAAGRCLDHDFPRLPPSPAPGRRPPRRRRGGGLPARSGDGSGPLRGVRGTRPQRCSGWRTAGAVTLCADGDGADTGEDPNRVAVNREFLLAALAAGGP